MMGGYRRRTVLHALAGALLPCRGHSSRAAVPVRLLVAGPPDSALAGWAAILATRLERHWPGGGMVRIELLGGGDGVTGANRFAAGDPSDATALLVPGAAAACWLAGDPRVQFDVARWLPLLCGLSGGMLAGRRALADARPQRPLRVAVADPVGPGAACLLGLDLLGVAARPVVQLGDDAAGAAAALRSGRADAAFLAGGLALAAARAAGAAPLLTLGSPDDRPAAAAQPVPVPSLAGWLAEAPPHTPELRDAWFAAAASVQLDHALVLSSLTDAASVALWREAATAVAADSTLLQAGEPDIRCVAAAAASDVLRGIATSSAALLCYRRWLAARLGYQPG